MVIDFHVHFFPDSIALKTTRELSQAGMVEACGDGTVHALKRYMKDDGVDLSINLPVATRPEQVMGINRKLSEQNQTSENVHSFGAMHPFFGSPDEIRQELEFIASRGMKGIKLHPEYQEFFPDDPKAAFMYEECSRLGLVVLMHAGKDLAYQTVKATPKRLAEVAKVKNLKLVLAHMGGYRMWDDVEHYLLGVRDIYFDTAFSAEMENWQMKEIILGHGPYKILFASDFPWQRQSIVIGKVKELGLGKDFEDWIFYKNAKQLLNLENI